MGILDIFTALTSAGNVGNKGPKRAEIRKRMEKERVRKNGMKRGEIVERKEIVSERDKERERERETYKQRDKQTERKRERERDR